jgi:hypothetical protein
MDRIFCQCLGLLGIGAKQSAVAVSRWESLGKFVAQVPELKTANNPAISLRYTTAYSLLIKKN